MPVHRRAINTSWREERHAPSSPSRHIAGSSVHRSDKLSYRPSQNPMALNFIAPDIEPQQAQPYALPVRSMPQGVRLPNISTITRKAVVPDLCNLPLPISPIIPRPGPLDKSHALPIQGYHNPSSTQAGPFQPFNINTHMYTKPSHDYTPSSSYSTDSYFPPSSHTRQRPTPPRTPSPAQTITSQATASSTHTSQSYTSSLSSSTSLGALNSLPGSRRTSGSGPSIGHSNALGCPDHLTEAGLVVDEGASSSSSSCSSSSSSATIRGVAGHNRPERTGYDLEERYVITLFRTLAPLPWKDISDIFAELFPPGQPRRFRVQACAPPCADGASYQPSPAVAAVTAAANGQNHAAPSYSLASTHGTASTASTAVNAPPRPQPTDPSTAPDTTPPAHCARTPLVFPHFTCPGFALPAAALPAVYHARTAGGLTCRWYRIREEMGLEKVREQDQRGRGREADALERCLRGLAVAWVNEERRKGGVVGVAAGAGAGAGAGAAVWDGVAGGGGGGVGDGLAWLVGGGAGVKGVPEEEVWRIAVAEYKERSVFWGRLRRVGRRLGVDVDAL